MRRPPCNSLRTGAPRPGPAARPAAHGPSVGDDLCAEIAKDIQDGARDLARLLPSFDGEEPLRQIAQLQEQLDGLTAAVVGRARYRRVTWASVSTILRISEDTVRHRYTERYILRRLARFNRSETMLTTLAGLPGSTASPDTPADSETAAETGDAGSDRGDSPEQQSAPIASSGAAYNRLSPILSMLIRTAQLTNKDIAAQLGFSASFLSGILSGERVPTWALTRKFAQACGADPAVLRTMWESEKLSEKHREPDPDLSEVPRPAAERLRSAIHTLHLRAGRPTPTDITVASRWLLPASAVASRLEATALPHPEILETYVHVLGGDTDHFTQLLHDAHREASQDSALVNTPNRHRPADRARARRRGRRHQDPQQSPHRGPHRRRRPRPPPNKRAKQHLPPHALVRPRPLTAVAEAWLPDRLAPVPFNPR
ncbi:helix-turn-helix domain-containing protein [Streptomyces sp. NPDC057253]|uniref:helix-turn-helix domain-containing protein n=1 Tax=Streptomyces sp. NPDC057253 TaxID=3346069 RepID=UPI00362E8CFA